MTLTADKVEKRAHDLLFAGLAIKKAVEVASFGKVFTKRIIERIYSRLKVTKELSEKYYLNKKKSWDFIKFVKSEIKSKRKREDIISDLLQGGLSKEHSDKLYDAHYQKR